MNKTNNNNIISSILIALLFLLSITFIVFSLYSLNSVEDDQSDVRQYVLTINELSSINRLIDEIDNFIIYQNNDIPSEKTSINSITNRLLSELLSYKSVIENADNKSQTQNKYSSTFHDFKNEFNKSYQTLKSSSSSSFDSSQNHFLHNKLYDLNSEIKSSIELTRKKLSDISTDLIVKWNYLYFIVIFSTCIILFCFVLIFLYRRNIKNKHKIENELKKYKDDLEELVQKRTTELQNTTNDLSKQVIEFNNAKKMLEFSEKKYKTLVDLIPDAIIIHSEDIITFINYSGMKLLKIKDPIDILGSNIFDIIHPEYHQIVNERNKLALNDKKLHFLEEEFIAFDKSSVYVEVLPVVFKFNESYLILDFIRNISERKKATKALNESEERYKRLIDTSPDAIIQTDLEGKFLTANKQALILYNVKDIIELKEKYHDAIGLAAKQDQKKLYYNCLKAYLNTLTINNLEILAEKHDGKCLSTEVNMTVTMDNHGKPDSFISIIRDITERKLIEERLLKEKLTLDNIINSNPFSIIILDKNGKYLHGNNALIELFKDISQGDYSSFIEYIFNEYNILEKISKLEQSEILKLPEFWINNQILNKDIIKFTEKCLRAVIFPVLVIKNQIDIIVMMLEDVTEHRKITEALQKSENKFQVLFESNPDAIFLEKLDGKIIDCNDVAVRMYGYSKEKLLTMYAQDLMPSEILNIFPELVDKELDFKGFLIESLNIRSNGEVFPCEVSSKVLKIEDEMYSLVVVKDITLRKQAEENLKKTEENYRYLYETALVGMFKTRIYDGKLLIANSTYLKMLGFTDEELKDKNAILNKVNVIDSYKYPEKRQEFLNRLYEDGYVSNYNLELLTKNGDSINVIISARIYPDKDIIEGSINEITKLKEVEKQLLIAKHQAEEANRLKSEFLANMSHELRTPLNSILGFSQLILHDNNISDDINEYSNRILKAGKRLLILINDVLEISKIEAGKIVIEKEEISLTNLLKEVEAIISIQLLEKKLKYVVNIDKNVPDSFISDYNKLSQILLNLIGNAYKFTNQGEITVNIEKVLDVDYVLEKSLLLFSIKDTGIGIPEDKKSIVFEPFMQADGSLTRRHGGTGLGLSISKKFAELLGGQMWFISEYGKGSTFFFTIDISDEFQTIEQNEC